MPADRVFSIAPLVLAAGLAAGAATPGVAGNVTVRGVPVVIDGARMIVAGKKITLTGIVVPALKTMCTLRRAPLDCGRLARAGLQDLVIGAPVSCTRVRGGTWRCLSGGYDLSYGLIHAGWARPVAGAPAIYRAKVRDARAHNRGLWQAVAKGFSF